MYIDLKMLGAAIGIITGLITIIGLILGLYRQYLKNKQLTEDMPKIRQEISEEISTLKKEISEEISKINVEQCLVVWGVLASLKGLREQGCNGPVKEGIDRLEKHLNKQAHNMEE